MVLTTVEETQAPEAARYLLARTQQQIVDPEASRPIIEMIATIMVYKFTNLSRQEVDAMLGLQLADTRVYREAKEEGRLEGESALILRLLQRRFGAVNRVLASRIQALEIEQLEALAEALLDFTALNELVLWLNRYSQPLRDLRFDNVPFGRTQFAPTLWTKSVTVGAQSLRPPIDWDIIPTQVP